MVGGAGCGPGEPDCATDLTTTFTYESNGGPLSTITTPDDARTVHSYDSLGRVLTTSRGDATTLFERSESVYDSGTGLRTRQSLWGSDDGMAWTEHSRTEYGYLTSGQLQTTSRPRFDGDLIPVEETTYDAAGRVEAFRDANHAAANVKYHYDPLGRLTSVEQLLDGSLPEPAWAVTSYQYDGQGNLTVVTDANGNRTEYVVDDFGQTTRIESPVTGVTAMTYNGAGQLATRTDSRGVVSTTTYSDAGRVTEVAVVDGPTTELLEYDYDAGGRRTLARATLGTATPITDTFVYDRRGQVLSQSSDRGGGTVYTTGYGYTHDGALEKVTYPSGRVVEYEPDFAGRPTAIDVTPPGGSAAPVVTGISYRPQGPVVTMNRGVAGVETRVYDWQYRRTGQVVTDDPDPNRLDLELDYDPAGNLITITDTIGLGRRNAGYGYDDLGRLRTASVAGVGRVYSYDDIGNITSLEVVGAGTLSFGYPANGSGGNSPVLGTVGGNTVSTDVAGNITDDGQASYAFTPTNHLASRTLAGDTSSYTFGADGRRVGMTRGTTVLDVVLGPGGQRLARVLDGEERDYVWLGDSLVGYVDGAAGEVVHVITDHIGYPLMAVDSAGATVWDPLHEPYGEVVGSFSQVYDPGLRYPGQWQDEVEVDALVGTCASGECEMPGPLGGSVSLFENGFRWYRAGWGRYSQADPIGLLGGTNPAYAYSDGGPLRYVDQFGLYPAEPPYRDPFVPVGRCREFEDRPESGCKCNANAIRARLQGAITLRDGFCAAAREGKMNPGRILNPFPRTEDTAVSPFARGVQVGGIVPEAWYVDQGDDCLNACTCAHEEQHEKDLQDPRVNRIFLENDEQAKRQFINETECAAYQSSVACLTDYAR